MNIDVVMAWLAEIAEEVEGGALVALTHSTDGLALVVVIDDEDGRMMEILSLPDLAMMPDPERVTLRVIEGGRDD